METPLLSTPTIGEKRPRADPLPECPEPEGKKPKLDEPEIPFVPEPEAEHQNQTHTNSLTPEQQTPVEPTTEETPQAALQQSMSDNLSPQPQNATSDFPIPVPRRRRVKTLEEEYEYEPDSKWNKIATARLIELYSNFGKRRVVEDKILNEVHECLRKGANPSVTISDGNSFFTYLSFAAERGVRKLVEKFLTEFESEFSDFDKKHALQAALRNREQEIAEMLILHNAPIDRETILCLFDIHMNDESERKILPLKAVLARIEQGKLDANEFFIPEILNQAIYAHNIAALEFLFERYPDVVRPLLVQATPVVKKTIRAGRGKAQDIGEGVPPLAYAAMMERGECLEVFLRNGADPNFTCEEMGGTLLHIVGIKNNLELIQLLIEYNADPRITNSRGVTVLSRVKGRKARKHIRDACAKFDRDQHIVMGGNPAVFNKLMALPEDEMPEALMGIPPPGSDLVLPPVYLHDFSGFPTFPPMPGMPAMQGMQGMPAFPQFPPFPHFPPPS